MKNKLVYLPTSYTGHLRLGTLRELNDLVHWNMQKKVLQTLLSVENTEVIFKVHPKGALLDLFDFQIEYLKTLNVSLVRTPILNYLDDIKDHGIIVSDYFGSGLFDCMERGAKCIFLDFGIREFFPEALMEMKKKTKIVQASLLNDDWTGTLKQEIQASMLELT